MQILVIGSGGREFAICQKFFDSKKVSRVFALPGNGGMSKIATVIDDIKIDEFDKIRDFCLDLRIDLVFIGPEQPLVDGLADFLRQKGIRVFGCSKAAAKLEGSKEFMKEIVSKAGVPTAKWQSFEKFNEAFAFARELGFRCAIKTDGLAAGKGVSLCFDEESCKKEIEEFLAGKFGKSSKKIVIEEFLEGDEVSYFVLTDGKNFTPLGFARDYKRALDGDQGLNTGGMGCFSPVDFADDNLRKKIDEAVIVPTLAKMREENCEFMGILFAGLMIVGGEPKLIEFNIRSGDPETQIILPRIKNDFCEIIEGAIDGKLGKTKVELDHESKFICVVVAANNYPLAYKKDIEISNLEEAEAQSGAKILHAGTKLIGEKLVSNGGRVLNVVASAPTFEEARKRAYKCTDLIIYEDKFYRRDIGLKAL